MQEYWDACDNFDWNGYIGADNWGKFTEMQNKYHALATTAMRDKTAHEMLRGFMKHHASCGDNIPPKPVRPQ